MGSTIRGNRDQRFNTRTSQQRRESNYGGDKQKTYDKNFTAHSSNRTPHAFVSEPSDTDHKIDHVHEIIRDQLVPRIQTKSANAVLSDRRYFQYYKRKRTGRRCSCYLTETSPENQCPICIGTGVVGGFDKFGTVTEILDYTTPNLVMVNVEPNLSDDTRPVYFRLNDDADFGYVEGVLPIRNNIGIVDNFMLYQPIFNVGTKVYAIDSNNTAVQLKDREDIVPFLISDKIKIRIEFTRSDERPLVSHFLLRYNAVESITIWGDIPVSEAEPNTSEFGQFEIYQELNVFFPYRPVLNFHYEDVLYRCSDGKLFKITMVKENIVSNILTSTDVRARYLIRDIDVGLTRNLLI